MNAHVVPHPRTQLLELRNRMSEAVESLIAAIDQIDGDPDLEPSLGSAGSLFYPFQDQADWSQGVTDDREEECEDEGAQCEGEGAQCDDEGFEEGW